MPAHLSNAAWRQPMAMKWRKSPSWRAAIDRAVRRAATGASLEGAFQRRAGWAADVAALRQGLFEAAAFGRDVPGRIDRRGADPTRWTAPSRLHAPWELRRDIGRAGLEGQAGLRLLRRRRALRCRRGLRHRGIAIEHLRRRRAVEHARKAGFGRLCRHWRGQCGQQGDDPGAPMIGHARIMARKPAEFRPACRPSRRAGCGCRRRGASAPGRG